MEAVDLHFGVALELLGEVLGQGPVEAGEEDRKSLRRQAPGSLDREDTLAGAGAADYQARRCRRRRSRTRNCCSVR